MSAESRRMAAAASLRWSASRPSNTGGQPQPESGELLGVGADVHRQADPGRPAVVVAAPSSGTAGSATAAV
jgi:hypothetical protein